jgi:geranylgeranylglycerol-phosphate geranylgeranyltransferase
MSSSMIVNDIFDIELDRIDHSNRPLVNGDISMRDAVGYLVGLLSITECLNMYFLPDNLQTIVHLCIFNILVYTPIYKKIPFIKNIFCAAMVAFSIFFAGLATSNKELLILNPRFSIFTVTLSILFFGSWYNEVLLDMGDIEGDRENRIYTVPVLYGLKNTWFFSGVLLFFNMISNTLSMYYLFGKNTAIWLPCIFSPMIYQHWAIYRLNYTKFIIKRTVNSMKNSLFAFVLFLCGLSFIHSGYVLPVINWGDIHWMHIATTVFI